MKEIFKKINRFKDMEFTEGKEFTFTLESKAGDSEKQVTNSNHTGMKVGGNYKITVKKYMTEPATVTFDFQDKWNNGKPMPLLVMTGEVIKETRGMYQMKLHGVAEPTTRCMMCGRTLTHPISRLYGIGPECGRHFHINPFDSEEELHEHLEELKQLFGQIEWEGWVIKSAIKEWEEVE